jgi:hypothetical protein
VNLHKLVNVNKTAAGILAALLLLAPAATPAQAVGKTITTQWYLASTGLAALKASGHDGTGIKIAVIDSAPDTSVPELQGANIKIVNPCNYKLAASTISHATTVASVLASPKYGWAPKAQYTFYVTRSIYDKDASDTSCPAGYDTGTGYLINSAVNDGADLISIQAVGGPMPDDIWAAARAALKGIPVMVAVGNETKTTIDKTASLNGTVGVGAIDQNNQPADFSNTGKSLTIMAPGTDIAARFPDATGKLTTIGTDQGTSYSTPMVTGALALAKQAWPNATGNQLIRSMLYTATNTTGNYETKTGWGILNAQKLVATNPNDQTDDAPLLDKDPTKRPNTTDITNYQNGLVDPAELANDPDYIYRGTNQIICNSAPRCELGTAPTTTPTTNTNTNTNTTNTNPVWPIAIGIGATTALATAITAIAITRRRKTNKNSTPNPTAPHPNQNNPPNPNPPYNPTYPPPNWPPTNQPPTPPTA